MHTALTQLAEQDPLINLRQDDVRHELYLSLYGEVQKEVIQATLAEEFGLDVTFRETTPICIERPAGTGSTLEILSRGDNPCAATVGPRIDPAPGDAGPQFLAQVDVRTIPLYVYKTVEEFRLAMGETIRETFRHGLYG